MSAVVLRGKCYRTYDRGTPNYMFLGTLHLSNVKSILIQIEHYSAHMRKYYPSGIYRILVLRSKFGNSKNI